jgi:hypothetical protein
MVLPCIEEGEEDDDGRPEPMRAKSRMKLGAEWGSAASVAELGEYGAAGEQDSDYGFNEDEQFGFDTDDDFVFDEDGQPALTVAPTFGSTWNDTQEEEMAAHAVSLPHTLSICRASNRPTTKRCRLASSTVLDHRSDSHCSMGTDRCARRTRRQGPISGAPSAARRWGAPATKRRCATWTPRCRYHAFGLIGTALSKKISVLHSSSLRMVSISPNASYIRHPAAQSTVESSCPV